MRRFLLLFLLWIQGLTPIHAQEKIVSDHPLPIMAWSGFPAGESTPDRFREMKEMGININLTVYPDAGAMQNALDLAQAIGMKMVTSCPELKTNPATTVGQFMNHPALAGYFLRDEPIRKDFEALGSWAREIESLDNRHFCFVNLISAIHPTQTAALGTSSYATYVSLFAKEVTSRLLSFDFYPILSEGIHENWYQGLEIFSEEAKKLQAPFWAFALASSYNDLHPTPTLPALRLQLFSNLAYGAQGLEYWSYWMSDGLRNAPINQEGKRTPVYDLIKQVNREIQEVAGVFVGSKVISVNHTGLVIPKGTTRLTKLPWAISTFETEGQGALVSQLEQGDKHFFVIVNRDLNQPMTFVIDGNDSLRRILKDGTIVRADAYAHSMEIAPGDMAIFMFPTKK
ncbi:MAG: hypothetical protein LWW85_01140 [Marinilabiliales bacterium]|nr:hypothetical protein [Marinilabiliales bacterium]